VFANAAIIYGQETGATYRTMLWMNGANHVGVGSTVNQLNLHGTTVKQSSSTFGNFNINRESTTLASAIKYSNTDGVKGYAGFDDAGKFTVWNGSIGVLATIDTSYNLLLNSLAVPRYITSGYTSGKITVSASTPGSPAKGDIWFDTS